MTETIRIGGLELEFPQNRDEAEGLDMFHMTVQLNARVTNDRLVRLSRLVARTSSAWNFAPKRRLPEQQDRFISVGMLKVSLLPHEACGDAVRRSLSRFGPGSSCAHPAKRAPLH